MKLFLRKEPRSLALLSNGYLLIFEKSRLPHFAQDGKSNQPTAVVVSMPEDQLSAQGFNEITGRVFNGLLGLISVNNNLFVGLITNVQKVAYPRWKLTNAGEREDIESIYQILNVDFFCLNSELFDSGFSEVPEQSHERSSSEHSYADLKKLFSDGSFYYSRDFDLSNILQERGLTNGLDYAIDNQDQSFIWNSNMINEVVQLRNRMTALERPLFDGGLFLTFVMRGFCKTTLVTEVTSSPLTLTIISRISTENKDNIFDLQGIDKQGHVSGFIETEIIFSSLRYVFAYVQTRGNVPLSWEVTEGQILHGKKIKLMEDPAYFQAAFDKHFDTMASKYGVVSVLNLVKPKSESQEVLSNTYRICADKKNVRIINVEYGSDILTKQTHKLIYLLKQDIYEFGAFVYDNQKGIYAGKQTGCLRISAFDSIERPNLVERCVSKEVIELTASELSDAEISGSFIGAHDKLWAENYFWLNRLFSDNFKNLNKYKRVYWKLFSSSCRVCLYDPLHAHISKLMRKMRKEFTYQKNISIFAGTFNVNGKTQEGDISEWLFPGGTGPDQLADVYVLGFEEVVELSPGQMLSTDPYAKQFWEKKIIETLNSAGNKRYMHAWGGQLGGVLLVLFISESEYSKVKHLEGDVKKTGFGGMSSNKGAVAVRFTYSTTKFCILVSHLAAGLENVEQRHHDYKTIVKNIRFAGDLSIKDHDVIIWMGDFNYRISLPNDEVRKRVRNSEYGKLFEKDQLNQQMIAGESFPYYNEMEINFPPTYKFDPGTKTYDTSEKMRIPAWTDRILSRGESLRQQSYGAAENIIFSDHRPVYATFNSLVTVVDEQLKAKLTTEIYERLTEQLADLTDEERYAVLNSSNLLVEKSESEDPMGPEIRRGRKLPPPSSTTRKWWIGTSKQVKIVLDVDPDKYVINPSRPINPFVDANGEVLFVQRGST
ncbi:LANO_0H19394g1_1 [Lachancea nothofagi CBS 11611]|uniref:phosphoinositide 5-phosphatase n=1 Tax=Lachancea nothofagi CBS 11611 TaxID=1266666 RepID=A0A1G4KNC6_9SACH|nr:LANO_0H19394g1_1 [Lachancea nothofagi CBS 11611]